MVLQYMNQAYKGYEANITYGMPKQNMYGSWHMPRLESTHILRTFMFIGLELHVWRNLVLWKNT